MTKSDLERAFLTQWKRLAERYPEPQSEVLFHPPRKWRLDYYWPARGEGGWPETAVAVELEGGTYSRGRHVRGKGFRNDCEKYNAALMDGIRVLRFTADMLDEDPVGCIQLIKEALDG